MMRADDSRAQERRLLRDTVGRLVASTDPSDLWRELARLGLLGLLVPTAQDPRRHTVEAGLVMEVLGNHVSSAPFLSTAILAACALTAAPDQAHRLDLLVTGDLLVACAIAEQSGVWNVDTMRTTARHSLNGWRVTGTKHCVLDADGASLLLVAAGAGPVRIFAVDPHAPGVRIKPATVLDPSRSMATVELEGAWGELLLDGPTAVETLEEMRWLGAAMLAAELVGVAARALDAAVAHVCTREQFGRPIGSFQAVKHLLADVYVALESARVTSDHALQMLDAGAREARTAVAVAKSICSEAAMRATGDAIQVLGGIGFTWEHPAHTWFTRAKSSALIFGDPSTHREHVAAALVRS